MCGLAVGYMSAAMLRPVRFAVGVDGFASTRELDVPKCALWVAAFSRCIGIRCRGRGWSMPRSPWHSHR